MCRIVLLYSYAIARDNGSYHGSLAEFVIFHRQELLGVKVSTKLH